jgi:hypothetical protein
MIVIPSTHERRVSSGTRQRSERAHERMVWMLRRMVTGGPHCAGSGFIVAWDTYTVDDFVCAFPEAKRTLRVYITGPNSAPMLNAAAKRAEAAGWFTCQGRADLQCPGVSAPLAPGGGFG